MVAKQLLSCIVLRSNPNYIFVGMQPKKFPGKWFYIQIKKLEMILKRQALKEGRRLYHTMYSTQFTCVVLYTDPKNAPVKKTYTKEKNKKDHSE